MGYFETDSYTQDFRELLESLQIPVEVYQRLELVFRQVLAKCPSTQYEYTNTEINEFGFGPCSLNVIRGRAKARDLYRQALTSFDALFEDTSLASERNSLEDQWLRNLASALRFHIALDSQVQVTADDEHVCYLAVSEAVFRPFFEMHFQNRQHTSERYHEFIALKRIMESGAPLNFQVFANSLLPLRAVTRDVERMNLLSPGWLDEVVSDRTKKAA